jgi:hypothetical protein
MKQFESAKAKVSARILVIRANPGHSVVPVINLLSKAYLTRVITGYKDSELVWWLQSLNIAPALSHQLVKVQVEEMTEKCRDQKTCRTADVG